MIDDSAQLRRRQDDAHKALDALSSPEGRASAPFMGQVFSGGNLPTVVPRIFLTHPISTSASEVAGAVPTVTVGSETVPVLVLGPRIPVAGDKIQAWQIDGKWIAQTPGPAMVGYPRQNYPGCLCANVPEVLSMVSHVPLCNGGMFQSCTIAYQSIPTALASLLLDVPAGSGKAWLSNEQFTDTNSDHFRYHLACSSGVFTLSRVYETSVFWSPFEDSVRMSWFLSAPGNTCTPFALPNGSIYSGGDPTCNVAIYEFTP